MEYHPVVQKILDIIKTNNCWFETFEHEPVRTSEEAAKVRTGYGLNQGAKALILKAGDKFIMFVMPAHLKLDSKKAAAVVGAKKMRFATEQEVDELTGGVQVGGVPPFGNLFNLEVVVDPQLFDNEKIIFNAGDRRFSVGMKSEDYKKLVNPQIAEIV